MLQISQHPDDSKAYRLQAEQFLPLPREELFDFFGDAFNLEKLTPGWMNFSVLTPPPIEMHAGQLIDYKLRIRGVPLRWRTKITAWEPPYRFVDEQVRGPYSRWVHEHRFSEEDGGTLCQDHVNYAPRGGTLINWLFVGRDVRRIFDYRRERMRRIFDAPQRNIPELPRSNNNDTQPPTGPLSSAALRNPRR